MHNFSLFNHILRVCQWPALVHTMEYGASQLIEAEANELTRQMPGVWAIRKGGAWTLDKNHLWNIPKGLSESKFEATYSGQYGFQQVRTLKGLAVGLTGQVFGVRTLSNPTQEGYQMHGRVSIHGKKLRAFTSSRLFERPDGSLVDVDVLIVSKH